MQLALKTRTLLWVSKTQSNACAATRRKTYTLPHILKMHGNGHHTCVTICLHLRVYECMATRKKMHALVSVLKMCGNVQRACITIRLHLRVSERTATCNEKLTLCYAFQKYSHLYVSKCTASSKENTCFVMCLENKRHRICVTIHLHLQSTRKCTARLHHHSFASEHFWMECMATHKKMHTMPCISKMCVIRSHLDFCTANRKCMLFCTFRK